jgi:hypothetical protein
MEQTFIHRFFAVIPLDGSCEGLPCEVRFFSAVGKKFPVWGRANSLRSGVGRLSQGIVTAIKTGIRFA